MGSDFHQTLPYVVTSSVDMSIKVWECRWRCKVIGVRGQVKAIHGSLVRSLALLQGAFFSTWESFGASLLCFLSTSSQRELTVFFSNCDLIALYFTRLFSMYPKIVIVFFGFEMYCAILSTDFGDISTIFVLLCSLWFVFLLQLIEKQTI